MKSKPKTKKRLAKEIDATELKLEALKEELESISEPASKSLKHRLAAIQIEEYALQRNFAEVWQKKERDEKLASHVETLLHHIEAEESSIEHEAEFLRQGAPSTLEFAYRIGSRFFNAGQRCVKKVIGDHHFIRQSPFVNTSIKSLDRIRAMAEVDENSEPGDQEKD